MELNNFITNVANQFDDTDFSVFNPDLKFRELDEWSSLNALAIMNMINLKYGIHITLAEMRIANTIQELFDLVQKRK